MGYRKCVFVMVEGEVDDDHGRQQGHGADPEL